MKGVFGLKEREREMNFKNSNSKRMKVVEKDDEVIKSCRNVQLKCNYDLLRGS